MAVLRMLHHCHVDRVALERELQQWVRAHDCAQHAHEGAREQLVCVDPYRANRPIPLDFNGTQSHLKWDDSYDVKLSTVVGLRFPRVKVPYNASVSHACATTSG